MLISLKQREVVSIDLSTEDRLRLIAPLGSAWVTLESCPDDFALTPATPLNFAGPGRLVIEPLESDMVVRAEFPGLPVRQAALLAAG